VRRNADAHFVPVPLLSDIVDICRRLDGLPLAIEMAASRVASLGVAGLKLALEQHWRLLTSRARAGPSRHETLEATLDWSHELLQPDEQRTLRRLALFANEFTLDAARKVALEVGTGDWAVADALANLIDKSMVVVEATDPPRYRLLETVRAYAFDQLASSSDPALIRARLMDWLLDFFTAAADSLWTMPERAWLDLVRPELANLRAAVHDVLGMPGPVMKRYVLSRLRCQAGCGYAKRMQMHGRSPTEPWPWSETVPIVRPRPAAIRPRNVLLVRRHPSVGGQPFGVREIWPKVSLARAIAHGSRWSCRACSLVPEISLPPSVCWWRPPK
jgi:hypothetical protein